MSVIPNEKQVVVPLLDIESSFVLKDENGVTSITFYRGDQAKSMTIIRARMREIVKINPWLTGRLIKNKQHKNIQLVYNQEPSDDIFEQLFHPNPSQIRIGSEMRYEELAKSTRSAVVKKGFKIINRPNIVTRITIVPDLDCPVDGFALIFSISHIAVDGDSYYMILNSLLSNEPIRPLRTKRNQAASNKIADVVGKEVSAFYDSLPLVLNLIIRSLFGHKTKCYAFYVTQDNIKTAKDKISATHTDGVEFISTNDILVSSFANTDHARFCIMAFNFRNRIEGIGDDDAGNYEGGLLFDEGIYSRPSSIRKVLQKGLPFHTTTKPIPGFWAGVRSTLCLITNWSTFSGNLELDGCEQYLHLPLYDPKTFPTDTAFVFKPSPDKLAVLYFAKSVKRNELLLNCELGESVSTKMFQ